MKKTNKILSVLLTVMLLIGTFANLAVFEISAADDKSEEQILEETVTAYLSTTYESAQAKVDTMQLKLDKDGYQLYIDEMTGETATVDKASGQILFSNPWDIADSKGTDNVKKEVMSQVVIKYTDNDTEKYFYSFSEAAIRGQIKVKNIKNGIRVEYIIGREESKKLVPRQISIERFDTLIKPYIIEAYGGDEKSWGAQRVLCYWLTKDPAKETSQKLIDEMMEQFPITKIKPIYVLDTGTSNTELSMLEEQIKTHCPHYSYEELDYDHEDTLYVGQDTNPPLFKMAIEYTLDEYGMSWRMPANGLRFDESMYQLTYISILPYMGAGAYYGGSDTTNLQQGYTFFPDGSGALFDFQTLNTRAQTSKNAKVYGQDYAYHTITGQLQEIVRYPVYGLVEQQQLSKEVTESVLKTEEYIDPLTGETVPAVYEDVKQVVEYTEDRGYVAIIEEGDALAELSTYHPGTLHKYNTVQMLFYPRPKDTYNISDAISVGDNKEWTVVSSRKYVGSYKVRYIMLTDDEIAEEKGIENYYKCSWIGMARAYSDYLEKQGILTRLKDEDLANNIPLYIETFGTFQTLEKILSIPVNVMTPFTTFEDVRAMYDELSQDGVDNINFKLTGYANGGYYSSVPYRLKWENAVGGKNGFNDLLDYAKSVNESGEKNLGIYPDFDFVYYQTDGFADGLSLKKHLVKTIDNRYTSKRVYSATYQAYESFFSLAISPAYFDHFYDKFTTRYQQYDPIGISVSTLGSDLNSDFDEDEPYNREDSKAFTTDIFKKLSEDYNSVMTETGNAYVWKYVNHIIKVPLDSSRYIRSSNAVPFMGTVLHGYIQIAGTPYNMEGNTEYAFLKAIENGASLYFTLTYRNPTRFKEYFELSRYYSISYEIWHDELVQVYTELNEVLKDVQTKIIIDHQFLTGERVPDIDELEADILAAAKEAMDSEDEAIILAGIRAQQAVLNARQSVIGTSTSTVTNRDTLLAEIANASANYNAVIQAIDNIQVMKDEVIAKAAPLAALLAAYEQAQANADAAVAITNEAATIRSTSQQQYNSTVTALRPYRTTAQATDEYRAANALRTEKNSALSAARTAYNTALNGTDEALIASTKAAYDQATVEYDAAVEALEAVVKAYCEANGAEAKAAYDAYEVALLDYNSKTADYDAKKAISDELTAIATTEKAAYDTAVAEHRVAETAVTTARTAVDTALTRLVNSYARIVFRQLDNDALKSSDTAIAAMELLNNTDNATEDIKNEAAGYVATTLQNVAEAVLNGMKSLTDIEKGIRAATAVDIERINNIETTLTNAFNNYKTARDNYTALLLSDHAVSEAEERIAKTAYDTATTEFNAAIRDVKAIGDLSMDKKANTNSIYTSAKLYKDYIDGNEYSTAEAKAEANDIVSAVKTEHDAILAAIKIVTDKVDAYNTMIKGYGIIELKVVEETSEETTEPETPSDTESSEDTDNPQTPENPEDTSEIVDLEEGETKYTSNDGQIVLVTYGGKDGNDNTPYKSFILNFNYFAITTKVNGVVYTIPANGYVVIYG